MKPANHDVCLSCNNWAGSVEHYYHYLFGYLFPLIIAHKRLLRRRGLGHIYIRSCAVLDAHTRALNLDKVIILPRGEHELLAQNNLSPRGRPLLQLGAPGLDKPPKYRPGALLAAAHTVRKSLAADIRPHQSALESEYPSGPRILLVNRDKPSEYYLSEDAEYGTAGAARRSLPNFDEIATAVQEQWGHVLPVSLENKTLAEQIALFEWADIIVGQHGAALANLIWSRGSTATVEIYPEMGEPRKRQHFERLAESMGLPHVEVKQDGLHSHLPPERVTDAIASLPATTHTRSMAWRYLRLRHELGQYYDHLRGRSQPLMLDSGELPEVGNGVTEPAPQGDLRSPPKRTLSK